MRRASLSKSKKRRESVRRPHPLRRPAPTGRLDPAGRPHPTRHEVLSTANSHKYSNTRAEIRAGAYSLVKLQERTISIS